MSKSAPDTGYAKPSVFNDDGCRSLLIGPPLTQSEAMEILDVASPEFAELRKWGYLRRIGPACAPMYNRKKVVAFAWGLRNSKRLAGSISFIFGYSKRGWADHTDDDGILF